MKTYKQQVKILESTIKRCDARIAQLESMLAEKEINPLDFQQLGDTCMKYYQALMTIKMTSNAATTAYELAESALRDE